MSGGSHPISSSRPTATSSCASCSLTMKLGFASTKWGSWYPRASASTLTLSPPTSRVSAARSSVVVTTFTAARASTAIDPRTPARINDGIKRFTVHLTWTRNQAGGWGLEAGADLAWSREPGAGSEHMRAMRADRKQELEQELVGRHAFGVVGAAVLAAHLAEFARPEGER